MSHSGRKKLELHLCLGEFIGRSVLAKKVCMFYSSSIIHELQAAPFYATQRVNHVLEKLVPYDRESILCLEEEWIAPAVLCRSRKTPLESLI